MPAKEDIGNLNNNKLYKELDPTNKLSLCKDDKKGQQAYYKGKKMKYLDYMQEVTDRIERKKKGRGADNLGFFQGVCFDNQGNII